MYITVKVWSTCKDSGKDLCGVSGRESFGRSIENEDVTEVTQVCIRGLFSEQTL